MTNSNDIILPRVKTAHPELYAEHTFHMKKAVSYTYNYSIIDEVLLECWDDMTIAEIALATNEYPNRIKYRVQVLQTLGMIKNKLNMERAELKRQRKEAVTWLKDIDTKLAQCS
tara:strand:+ start:99 stop:440 length:342 start_codon:yes stop_codon:yes gene_type:complete